MKIFLRRAAVLAVREERAASFHLLPARPPPRFHHQHISSFFYSSRNTSRRGRAALCISCRTQYATAGQCRCMRVSFANFSNPAPLYPPFANPANAGHEGRPKTALQALCERVGGLCSRVIAAHRALSPLSPSWPQSPRPCDPREMSARGVVRARSVE